MRRSGLSCRQGAGAWKQKARKKFEQTFQKESLEPQVPTHQGRQFPLTHGPPGQACEESRNGIVFPFFRAGNCGSEDARDLGEVPQVGSDKAERRTQVSWLPAPVPSAN